MPNIDAENNDDPPDPEFRYQLNDVFDEDSYDFDLENFPEYFDENGWPLFGDYDPYALNHPITGLSWTKNPRVPTPNEERGDYEQWFLVATEYDQLQMRLLLALSNGPKGTIFSDPLTNDSVYTRTSKNAFRGNLSYLHKHVTPHLEALIHDRQASVELSILWGEFCRITAQLPEAIERTQHRHSRSRKNEKSAQLKWYLHWRRRFVDEMGWSAREANRVFCQIVFDIVEGRVQPPNGFDAAWFEKACGTYEDESSNPPKTKFGRGLPDSLKRVKHDKRRPELLQSKPSDNPLIPPIKFEAYRSDS